MVEQLINHLSFTEGDATQDLAISKSAPDRMREKVAARETAPSQVTSKAHWQLIFDTIASGVLVFNAECQLIEANGAAQRIMGGSFSSIRQYLLQKQNIVSRPDGTPIKKENWLVSEVFRTGQARRNVLEGFTCLDGQQRWLQIDAIPIYAPDGTITHAVTTFVDVTERVEAERAIQTSETRFRALTEQSNDFTAIVDAEGRFQYVSSSYRRILGYEPEALIGSSIFNLVHSDDLLRTLAIFMESLQANLPLAKTECRIRHASGSWLTVEAVGYNSLSDPAINGVVLTSHDITERVKMEETLRYQTQYDGLTSLPNGTRFNEVLEDEVVAAQPEQRTMGVLVLDINRFKDVNDTFGHHHGDLLLKDVADRLQRIVPAPDIVARLSGDEFAILLLSADETKVQAVASLIQSALEEPCIVDGYPVHIDVSMGGSLYPAQAGDAVTLLRRADMALYKVKQAHESYVLFESAFEQYSPHRLTLIAELHHAIASGELRLFYQPKLDLQTRAVCGVEALVRWQHPSHGLMPPDQFIPLAEQTGLIKPLTKWVLEEAIRQCREWQCAGRKLSVAVNLSACNLRDITLPETIAALLEHYHVPARLLCIELTESVMITNMQRSLDILARIFAQGVYISIDDFGTGYSSLAYLKHLPIDELKIDRSFVQQMNTSQADATIVRSTVNLAHSLGLRVVAEGVEDLATLELLTAIHCNLAQGYYLSRPIPAREFVQWLDAREEATVRE